MVSHKESSTKRSRDGNQPEWSHARRGVWSEQKLLIVHVRHEMTHKKTCSLCQIQSERRSGAHKTWFIMLPSSISEVFYWEWTGEKNTTGRMDIHQTIEIAQAIQNWDGDKDYICFLGLLNLSSVGMMILFGSGMIWIQWPSLMFVGSVWIMLLQSLIWNQTGPDTDERSCGALQSVDSTRDGLRSGFGLGYINIFWIESVQLKLVTTCRRYIYIHIM